MASSKRAALSTWVKIIAMVFLSLNWYLLDNYLSSFGVTSDEDLPRKIFLGVAGSGGVGVFATLLILRFIGKTRNELEAAFSLAWGVLDIVTGAWILVILAPFTPQTTLDELRLASRVQFASGMGFLFAGMLLLADAISYLTSYCL